MNEVLLVEHEISNTYDQYAIVLKKRLPGCTADSVVGLMLKELSWTVFITLHRASVSGKVIDHRSPLVQGGLEFPVKVAV